MPNQPSKDSTTMLLRLPKKWKKRLHKVAAKLNEKYPEGNFSASSIARNAIIMRVEELEKEFEKSQ